LYKPSLVAEVAADASSKLASDAGAAATIFDEEGHSGWLTQVGSKPSAT
jgi:hypothetical protein